MLDMSADDVVELPLVALFTTGGTIASLKLDDGKGYRARISGDDLLERIPEYRSIARVEVTDFSCVPSQDLTVDEVFRLCSLVNSTLGRSDVAGAVITHGTATLEDTCFLMDLMSRNDKPIIGTGSVHPASSNEWDGRRNIRDALVAAASPEARGKGVMICLGGELHTARDAVKVRDSVVAFASPGKGALGLVDGDRVMFYRSCSPRWTTPLNSIDPRVMVLKVTLGADERLFRIALDTDVRGIVLEGFGGGGVIPSWFLPVVENARERGVPVVLCSRSPGQRVSFAGSAGREALAEAGVISGGDLPSHKARILLMVGLALTSRLEKIREIFSQVAP